MDPELRRMLTNISETVEENNEMLHKLHRAMVVGRIFRAVYWFVIIAIAVGAYYFIQPVVEGMAGIVGIEFGDGNRFLEFFQKFR